MTPAERLALSRLAIVDYLERREHGRDHRDAQSDQASAEAEAEADAEGDGDREAAQPAGRRPSQRQSHRSGWLGGVTRAARTWWRHHPAQLALEMATPTLQSYMRRKPFQVLGISVAVGAALAVTRPWRLISLTTVLIAVVKSSQLTGVVMSALTDVHDWQPAASEGARRLG